MKKLLLTIAMLVSVIALFFALGTTASAATYGDLTYVITDGEVEITGCDYYATDVEIPAEIDGYPVTSINYNAFNSRSSLTSVTVPDSVTSVGSFAFKNCYALEKINWNAKNVSDFTSSSSVFFNAGKNGNGIEVIFGDNVEKIPAYLFYFSSSKIKSITIGSGVKSIGEYAFCYCSELANITIPDSVTSIGDEAFYSCSGLTSVTIGNSVTCIGDKAFAYCSGLESISIPDSVTIIGEKSFCDCTGLTSVTIGDSVTSIGRDAFYSCTGLTKINWNAKNVSDFTSSSYVFFNAGKNGNGIEVIFGDNVEKIPAYLFYFSSSKIKSITIGSGVKSIGEYAFYYCSGLTSVTIGDSVTSIGDRAFYKCSGLTSVTIGDSVTSIGNYAFYGCSGLANIIIPDSVISIGEDAFSSCDGLASITIPDSVTSIGKYAFLGCSALENVYITDIDKWAQIVFYNHCSNPMDYAGNLYLNNELVTDVILSDSVTYISAFAFYGCGGITSIKIPNSVKSIGDSAFYDCDGLTSVIIGNGVTSIGKSAFCGCSSFTSISIPDSVTSIGICAFGGCSSLESITLPFVGANSSANETENAVFGYIFGYSTTESAGTVFQYYSTYSGYYYDIPSSLRTVKITNDRTIPYSAFYNCSKLTSIELSDTVTSIDDYAFYNCSGLTNVDLGESVSSFGARIFANCSKLESIIIPESVTIIDRYVFADFSGLTNVTIPDSCNKIESNAFYNCSGLKSVIIPDSVTIIGEAALYGCDSLESISLPFVGSSSSAVGTYDAVFGYIFGSTIYSSTAVVRQFYDYDDFCYYYIPASLRTVKITKDSDIPYGAFYDCSMLTSVELGDSITSIGDSAFYYCNGLTKVNLGNSVVYIDDDAFAFCDALESVKLPDSVVSIGERSFYSCRSFTDIIIPESVTKIGKSAFHACPNLGKISIYNKRCVVNDSFVASTTVIGGYADSTVYNYAEEYGNDFECIEHICDSVVKEYLKTCTSDGYTEYICLCGESYMGSFIKATGHEEVIIPEKAPTCTETGLSEGKKCSVCDEIIVAQEVIPTTVHTPGKWVVVVEAQYGVDGKKELQCTACGFAVDEKIIPALPEITYIIGDVTGDGKINAIDARIILRVAAQIENVEDYNVPLAVFDLTGDGKVNALDARKALRIGAQLE